MRWSSGNGKAVLVASGVLVMTICFTGSLLWASYAQYPSAKTWKQLWEQALQDNRATFLDTFYRANPPEVSDLPICHVSLSDEALPAMLEAIRSGDPELNHEPGGHKPWFKALYKDESGVVQEAKVALRGLGERHHNLWKPSLRVKIKKTDVELGRRYVELTRPEDPLALSNWLCQAVAAEVGVLAQIEDQVPLYLNNRYAGLYSRSYRTGEKLALVQGRLPGTFFKGDLPEFGLALWESMDPWRISGEETVQAREALAYVLELRASKVSPRRKELLERALDTRALAQWSALAIGVGSIHTDFFHNQVFFFDSARGKLEPVAWDLNGFGLNLVAQAPVDFFASPIEDMMSDYPEWVHQRNLYLKELVDGPLEPGNLKERIEAQLKLTWPWLKSDPALGRLLTRTTWLRLERVSVRDLEQAKSELYTWIDARHALLVGYLGSAKVAVDPLPGERCRVTVFGTVAVKGSWEGNERLLYPGLSKSRTTYSPIFTHQTYLLPAPLVYELPVSRDAVRFENAVTGQPLQPQAQIPNINVETRSFLPPEHREAPPKPIHLGPGIVEIKEDLVTQPAQTLAIEPGTTLKLGPGVNIFCRGPVLALGTASSPIYVEGMSEKPWGSFSLTGADCGTSEFRYVNMEGGSTGQLDFLAFKGMFNAYVCPKVILTHCKFGRNSVGDDAVNFAESEVEISNSSWRDARSDALDLDQCRGWLRDCTFWGSGHDGLEVSTGRLDVSRCRFEKNGDKGISIGEASRVTVLDSFFLENVKGTQVRDDSIAELSECEFEGNQITAEANRKKWLYRRGGTLKLSACTFKSAPKFVKDKRSEITVDGVPTP